MFSSNPLCGHYADFAPRVLESLAIIVDLVENFTFEPTEDNDKVVRMPTGLMSAWIRGRESEGPQLWLKVTRIS